MCSLFYDMNNLFFSRENIREKLGCWIISCVRSYPLLKNKVFSLEVLYVIIDGDTRYLEALCNIYRCGPGVILDICIDIFACFITLFHIYCVNF